MDDKCFVFCRKFSLLPIKSCVPGFPEDLETQKFGLTFRRWSIRPLPSCLVLMCPAPLMAVVKAPRNHPGPRGVQPRVQRGISGLRRRTIFRERGWRRFRASILWIEPSTPRPSSRKIRDCGQSEARQEKRNYDDCSTHAHVSLSLLAGVTHSLFPFLRPQ